MNYNDLSDRSPVTPAPHGAAHLAPDLPASTSESVGRSTTPPDPKLMTLVRALARMAAARDLRSVPLEVQK